MRGKEKNVGKGLSPEIDTQGPSSRWQLLVSR